MIFHYFINTEGRTTRKDNYFFMGQIKSLPLVNSLLDFNSMTSRDSAINIMASFIHLVVGYF